MTDEQRVSRLAAILVDHECFDWIDRDRFATEADRWRTQSVAGTLAANPSWDSTTYRAVRAAIAEAESGEVFGAEDRCCTCGTSSGVWPWALPYEHYGCTAGSNRPCGNAWVASAPVFPHNGTKDDLIRRILLSRKLYRQWQKAKPVEAVKPLDAAMVERVAKAIHTAAVNSDSYGDLPPWKDCYEARREEMRAAARAAIGVDAPKPASPAPKAEERRQPCSECDGLPNCNAECYGARFRPKPPPAERRCDTCARQCKDDQACSAWTAQTCGNCAYASRILAEPSTGKPRCDLGFGLVTTGELRCLGSQWKAESPKPPPAKEAARTPSLSFKVAMQQGARPPRDPWFGYRDPFTGRPVECFCHTRESASGNPRGDEWLREVWRKGDHETEILRRVALVEDELRVHSRTEGRRVDGLRAEVDSIRAGQAAELEKIRALEGRMDARKLWVGPVDFDNRLRAVEQRADSNVVIVREWMNAVGRENSEIDKRLTALERKPRPASKGKGRGKR